MPDPPQAALFRTLAKTAAPAARRRAMAAIFFIVGTSYRDVLRSAYCNSGDCSRRVAQPEALNGVLWTYPSAKVHLGILA
jgi:hypothetical protein